MGHVGIDWELLETVDEATRAREIVGLDTLFELLFQTALEDSYREITVEFFSSFKYAMHPNDHVEDPDHVVHEITFHLAGQEFGMRLRDFAVHSGLYTQAELDTNVYTYGGSIWESSQKATAIRDPRYRYLHRIIGSSFVPQFHNRDKVNMGVLFFLYCLLRPQRCAFAACLAEYFAAAYHWQERGRLYGGSYFTAITRFLWIVPESDPLLSLAIPSTRLGRASVSSMRLTH
ncbi:hypothetical protein Hanom_Chr03g00204541 [Helianthus anomalus]